MRTRLRWALICAPLAGGCYLAHERRDAGVDAFVPRDAGVDALAADAQRADAGHCMPHDWGWSMPCSPAIQATCEAFAAEEAFGRYAHTQCVQSLGGGAYCGAGTICSHGECLCTPTRACDPNVEVCVSDTPDGPRYCIRMCTPR